jgi:lipoyl(octanoyl) transferase
MMHLPATGKPVIRYRDLRLADYGEAWDLQKELFAEVISAKRQPGSHPHSGYLLFCEHPPVFTLGKSGSDRNLLVDESQMQREGIKLFRIERGGDITFHGPGQLVAYPIFDLAAFPLGIREYILRLEDVVLQTLAHYRVEGERLEGATGIWLDARLPGRARKICAIGVRASHSVTMHGLAFNVNTELRYFSYINPCGFVDKGVTSLEKELGHRVGMDEVKELMLDRFISVFGFRLG